MMDTRSSVGKVTCLIAGETWTFTSDELISMIDSMAHEGGCSPNYLRIMALFDYLMESAPIILPEIQRIELVFPAARAETNV